MWFSRSIVLADIRDDFLPTTDTMNVLDMTGSVFWLIAAASVTLRVDRTSLLVRTVRVRLSRSRAVDLLVLGATAFGLLHTVVALLVVVLIDPAYVFFDALQDRFLVNPADCLLDRFAARVACV
jgi:hypothetical protein